MLLLFVLYKIEGQRLFPKMAAKIGLIKDNLINNVGKIRLDKCNCFISCLFRRINH